MRIMVGKHAWTAANYMWQWTERVDLSSRGEAGISLGCPSIQLWLSDVPMAIFQLTKRYKKLKTWKRLEFISSQEKVKLALGSRA